MCNCTTNIRDKLAENIKQNFGKPGKPVENFFIQTTLGGRAVVNIGISLKGQLKLVESYVVADFCPWCGIKY